ncbi:MULTISPECIES: hypothetical protein [Streptomyces]|uniref:hypothetical protein n=1 Tax=unclassified Streptomyces TaxID=2593676 RepID=UPI0029AA5877|nr:MULTISPECIES: hypothetical protein [unclassified Streptomyces]MDX3767615.1 hypothetical protein [Streptomyces sp. AK08-01B]MDX3821440.1 hypothetical protein [Streptomyces sp. AK08-01A]
MSQTDRHLAQGVSTVGVPAAERVLGTDFSDSSGRDRIDGARVPSGSHLMDHDKWLVGLRFHTANRQRVWLYYVVDEVFDTTHAVPMAIQRANSDPKRVARGGIQAEADQVEVQQIHRDGIGRFSLTRCSV